MFTRNPFAALGSMMPPSAMQTYVVLMVVAVVLGTLFDIMHKGSARYFFDNWRRSKAKGPRAVSGGDMVSIAIKTGVVDVLASGEFCNARRRLAHLLTMYGFILYVVTTALLVFRYATPETPAPAVVPLLWWIGRTHDLRRRLLVLVLHPRGRRGRRQLAAAPHARRPLRAVARRQRHAGSRVGGAAGERQRRRELLLPALHRRHDRAVRLRRVVEVRAHVLQARGRVREAISKANGTAENLPTLTRDDPEQRARHSMELLRDAPMDMGLGIKREPPRHY
jgi:hypothetical protein